MHWQKKERVVAPYSKLAPIYDDVMSHVNYKQWAQFIDQIINLHYPAATCIADISCGTGTFLENLAIHPFKVFGFDYSYEMIHIARLKMKLHQLSVPLWIGDIKRFSFKCPMDVIVCLYDSINYLLCIEELNLVCQQAYQELTYGGLFIFDICTEKNSIKYFENYIDKNRRSHYKYVRSSNYDRRHRIHKNIFKINFSNDSHTYVEIHEQKIYFIEEIEQLIINTPFQLLNILDGFTLKTATEQSLRAHFVLKKA